MHIAWFTGGSSGPVGGGGKFFLRGPNLPPFSTVSTDLGHFILKLLNFEIFFLFDVYFLHLFTRFGWSQTGHFMPLGRAMALNAPLDPPVAWLLVKPCIIHSTKNSTTFIFNMCAEIS